jgi:hypothetical protein
MRQLLLEADAANWGLMISISLSVPEVPVSPVCIKAGNKSLKTEEET